MVECRSAERRSGRGAAPNGSGSRRLFTRGRDEGAGSLGLSLVLSAEVRVGQVQLFCATAAATPRSGCKRRWAHPDGEAAGRVCRCGRVDRG